MLSCGEPTGQTSGSDDDGDDQVEENSDSKGGKDGVDEEGDDSEPSRSQDSGTPRRDAGAADDDGDDDADDGDDDDADDSDDDDADDDDDESRDAASKPSEAGARDAGVDARVTDPPEEAGQGGRDAATKDAAQDAGPERDAAPPSNPQGPIASLIGKTMYSSKPTGAATWLVDANVSAVQRLIEADMRAAGGSKFPVFSLYRYYPNSGTNAAAHRTWVTGVAEAIGRAGGPAVVVVEPDAFALGTKERADVDTVLNTAIGILKDKAPNAAVFLDIGHSNWIPANMVVARAKSYSNYARIDGWASNTSNFQAMQAEINFAKMLYAASNKPTIIDSSRNGRGRPPQTIFNPPPSEWDPGPPFAFHPDEPAVLFNYYNKPSNERD